jgi:hypothetical protein
MTQLALKLTLPDDTSHSGPALVHFTELSFSFLIMAWSGSGNELINLMHVDPVAGLVSKFTSLVTARGSPCLCAHSSRAFIAWSGTETLGLLNVSPLNIGFSPQGPFDHPFLHLFDNDRGRVTLAETSTESPALASHGAHLGGQLFLAWTGVGNNNLNLMVSQGDTSPFGLIDGLHFGGKITLPETAIGSPCLASHHNHLFIAWTGSDHRLNIARVAAAGSIALHGSFVRFHITGLTNKITLSETSDHGPTLVSFGGQLIVGWTGQGEGLLNCLFSRDDGATFQGKFTSSEKSLDTFVLAAGGGRLNVSWTGVDPGGHLNLAVLDP